jgi:hypothetical protein
MAKTQKVVQELTVLLGARGLRKSAYKGVSWEKYDKKMSSEG